MSFKARRLTDTGTVERFDWGVPAGSTQPGLVPAPPPRPGGPPPVTDVSQLEAIERDAFTKGYAQGERAGAEAAAARGQAMLRRLSQTLEELSALRNDMILRTERQMVQLALAIAKKVVTREVSMDRGLLTAMARVAIERLGAHASATIRLHPEDHAAVAGQPGVADSGHITIVADSAVSRGGCMVRSDFGFMDVSPEAQFEELAKNLLEETEPALMAVPVTTTAASRQFEVPIAD